MHSSPSSEDETETMFPTANDPPTPTTKARLIQAFNSELSPPSSQDPPTSHNGAPAEDDMMDYTPGQQNGNAAAVREQTVMREPSRKMEMGDKPGAAWNNPRAQEEYARAMENVVDQKFNLSEWDLWYRGIMVVMLKFLQESLAIHSTRVICTSDSELVCLKMSKGDMVESALLGYNNVIMIRIPHPELEESRPSIVQLRT